MNPAVLQIQLQLPYHRTTWFSAAGLLSQILPGRLEIFAQPVEFALTSEAEQAVAVGFRQLGRVSLPAAAPGGPERIVALHEITVAANIDLLRNRVGLRRLVARGIDEVNAHAVLAFFVQPGETAYRLTFAARESVMNEATLAIERRETAARRFTFVLGPGEPRRTAALRLAGLAAGRARASLDELNAAFAVESLNDEFFKLYRAHYEAFRDHLVASDAPVRLFGIAAAELAQADVKLRDRAFKPVRDFVKKLLGRLVFLHFLQKKGWLGCPAERTDWTHGDPRFLDRLFRTAPAPDRFHSERLVPLFYETLNRPDRAGDRFTVTGTRVPYLNGGLFERDFPGVDRVDFPGELFAGLFEFLGGYHFTIDENDPEDHEIGIDPEMLGHIFENLLEDNKDKGAYYTPKAVVHYMARQSLSHALAARYPGDAAAPAEIAAFLRTKDPVNAREDTWLARHATDLAAHLDDLRICDPAIGSGAFPIGLLHEIYWAKLALNPSLPRAAAKRAIIQNSIHGVDLDAGAVEIARLRFWLALVVDEAAPSPLPNLDYQIMQGNSLLESFEGEPLDDLAESPRYGIRRLGSDQNEFDLGGGQAEIVEVPTAPHVALTELRERYFRCHDPVEKGRLRGEIDAAVLQAIDARLARRRDELEISLQSEAAHVRDRARTAKETKQRAAMEAELAALTGKTARLHALLCDPRAERPFFLWHLWFRHVLAAAPEGRGGFDIVIANPPYVQITPDRFTRDEIQQLKSFDAFSYKADLYELFLEHALTITAQGGMVCYITPIIWLALQNSEQLRRLVLNAGAIEEIRVWGEDVFENAVVSTQTIFIAIGSSKNSIKIWRGDGGRDLPVESVRNSPFLRIDFMTDESERKLISKITKASIRLAEYCEVSQGITPYDKQRGQTQELISNRGYHAAKQINKTYGQWLNGRDVARYQFSWSGEWLSYGDWLGAPREAKFFTSDKILCREVPGSGKRIQAVFHSGTIYCGHSISPVIARIGVQVALKFILAILNSSVASWYAELCCPNFAKDIFPKLNPSDIKELPVPIANSADQTALTALVDQILAAKRAGDAAAVARLEGEIDAHVYRLYGLTEAEIALVEGRLSSSAG